MIEHFMVTIAREERFNVFSHSTSRLAPRKSFLAPPARKRLASRQREDDDIGYFGKCITGVSRVCPPPHGLFIAPGVAGVADFELQPSVMELRISSSYVEQEVAVTGIEEEEE